MDRLNEVQAGSKATAKWANQVVDELRRLKIVPGNGIRVTVTGSGTVIALDTPAESSNASGVAISDVIPCKVVGGDAITGYDVYLYANGIDKNSTSSGKLYLPEVTTMTKIPSETWILAHICEANFTQSDEDGDEIAPSSGD